MFSNKGRNSVLGKSESPCKSEAFASNSVPSKHTSTKLGSNVVQELKINQRRILIDSLEIGIPAPEQIMTLGERQLPNGVKVGQLLNSKTLNYKKFTPHRDGLFCERIFGPVQSFVCACGKKKENIQNKREDKGKVETLFCSKCEVEYITKNARRHRLGYIKLFSPVTHIWYLKGRPSSLSLFLGKRKKAIISLAYCNAYLVEQTYSESFLETKKSIPSHALTVFTQSKRYRKEIQFSCREKVGPLTNKKSDTLLPAYPGFASTILFSSLFLDCAMQNFVVQKLRFCRNKQGLFIGQRPWRCKTLFWHRLKTLLLDSSKSILFPNKDYFTGTLFLRQNKALSLARSDQHNNKPLERNAKVCKSFAFVGPELCSGKELDSVDSFVKAPLLSTALTCARIGLDIDLSDKAEKQSQNFVSMISTNNLDRSVTPIAWLPKEQSLQKYIVQKPSFYKYKDKLRSKKAYAKVTPRAPVILMQNCRSFAPTTEFQVYIPYIRAQTLPFLPSLICSFYLRDCLISFLQSLPCKEDIPIPLYCQSARRYPLRDVHKFLAECRSTKETSIAERLTSKSITKFLGFSSTVLESSKVSSIPDFSRVNNRDLKREVSLVKKLQNIQKLGFLKDRTLVRQKRYGNLLSAKRDYGIKSLVSFKKNSFRQKIYKGSPIFPSKDILGMAPEQKRVDNLYAFSQIGAKLQELLLTKAEVLSPSFVKRGSERATKTEFVYKNRAPVDSLDYYGFVRKQNNDKDSVLGNAPDYRGAMIYLNKDFLVTHVRISSAKPLLRYACLNLSPDLSFFKSGSNKNTIFSLKIEDKRVEWTTITDILLTMSSHSLAGDSITCALSLQKLRFCKQLRSFYPGCYKKYERRKSQVSTAFISDLLPDLKIKGCILVQTFKKSIRKVRRAWLDSTLLARRCIISDKSQAAPTVTLLTEPSCHSKAVEAKLSESSYDGKVNALRTKPRKVSFHELLHETLDENVSSQKQSINSAQVSVANFGKFSRSRAKASAFAGYVSQKLCREKQSWVRSMENATQKQSFYMLEPLHKKTGALFFSNRILSSYLNGFHLQHFFLGSTSFTVQSKFAPLLTSGPVGRASGAYRRATPKRFSERTALLHSPNKSVYAALTKVMLAKASLLHKLCKNGAFVCEPFSKIGRTEFQYTQNAAIPQASLELITYPKCHTKNSAFAWHFAGQVALAAPLSVAKTEFQPAQKEVFAQAFALIRKSGFLSLQKLGFSEKRSILSVRPQLWSGFYKSEAYANANFLQASKTSKSSPSFLPQRRASAPHKSRLKDKKVLAPASQGSPRVLARVGPETISKWHTNGAKEILSYTGGGALEALLKRFNTQQFCQFLFGEIKILRRYYRDQILLEYKKDQILDKQNQNFSIKDGVRVSRTNANKGASLFCRRIYRTTRRLKVVQLLMRNKRRPEWMMISALPVLPPDLRPVLQMGENLIVASDLNTLYQRVIYRNNRHYKGRFLDFHFVSSIHRLVQDAVDRLIENGKGGSTPFSTPGGRPLKSLSDILKGKRGRFRFNLLGKRVDFSGRSVIVVSPNLKIHECGLPREMALELYKYLLIRQLLLKKRVSSIVHAKKLIKERNPFIWNILREIIYYHPVLLNRAPTLHRLGIQAFQPKLTLGNAILLHPLVCAGFNADFDGDQMGVHLPLSPIARAEAWDLLWSRNNLLSPATGQPILLPSQDMVLGFYYMTALLPYGTSFRPSNKTLIRTKSLLRDQSNANTLDKERSCLQKRSFCKDKASMAIFMGTVRKPPEQSSGLTQQNCNDKANFFREQSGIKRNEIVHAKQSFATNQLIVSVLPRYKAENQFIRKPKSLFKDQQTALQTRSAYFFISSDYTSRKAKEKEYPSGIQPTSLRVRSSKSRIKTNINSIHYVYHNNFNRVQTITVSALNRSALNCIREKWRYKIQKKLPDAIDSVLRVPVFTNIFRAINAYQKKQIDIHTPIWIKWIGKSENGEKSHYPLEVRINVFGYSTQIYSTHKYQNNICHNKDFFCNLYIRTTAGRILVNNLIAK